jgi:hypothetical protein
MVVPFDSPSPEVRPLRRIFLPSPLRALALLGVMLGIATAGPATAEAIDGSRAAYVQELKTRFGPLKATDEELGILLDGPAGSTYRRAVDSARMGEAVMSGRDELLAASVWLGDHLFQETLGKYEIDQMDLLDLAAARLIDEDLIPWYTSVRGVTGALQAIAGYDSQIDGLVSKFRAVYFSGLERDLLRQYVGARRDGASPEDAYADIDALITPEMRQTLADSLGVAFDEYPQTLELHYQFVSFAQDPGVIASVRGAVDTATVLLREYERPAGPDGPLKELAQGSDRLRLVNTGPIGARLTYLDGGDEVGSRHLESGEDGVVSLDRPWADVTDIRVAVDGVGTVTVPADRFRTDFYYDPIESDDAGPQARDFGVERVITRNDGAEPPASLVWDFGDRTPGATTGVGVRTTHHVYACPGKYAVKATISAGSHSATAQSTEDIADSWGTRIAMDRQGAVLPNSPVEFSVGGDVPTEGVSYLWQFSDGTVARSRTVTHSFSQEATYAVNLIVTDDRTHCDRFAGTQVAVGSSAITLPRTITRRTDLEPHQVYVLPSDGVEIREGAELVAHEETIIKSPSSATITGFGRLVLDGTPEFPAVLTSIDDDSAGGDTNRNGPSAPTGGAGITVFGTGGLEASNATIAQTRFLDVWGPASLTDTTVRGGGIATDFDGALTSTRTRFENTSGTPVTIRRPGSSLVDTTITGTSGIRLESTTRIDGLEAPNSTVPVSMPGYASGSPLRRISAAPGARFDVTPSDFNSSVSWTNKQIPYRVTTGSSFSSQRVVRAHLQVYPSVRVQVDPAASFTVQSGGGIDLAGTADAPVTVDGVNSANWGGITVAGGGDFSASHTTLSGGVINLNGGTGSLEDSKLRGDAAIVTASGGVLDSQSTTFDTNGAGAVLGGGGSTLADTTVTGSAGIKVNDGTSTIDGLQAPNSIVPVSMNPRGSSSVLRHVSAAPGARFDVTFGDFNASTTWESTDLPYRITRGGASVGDLRHIRSQLKVGAGVNVQVEAPSALQVDAGGELNLAGTADARVKLDRWNTSAWDQLTVLSGGTLNAAYATFAGANRPLDVQGTATVHRSRMLVGLAAALGSSVDATRNWWGAAAGPTAIGAQPATGPVAFSPWCADADCTDFFPHAQAIVFTSPAPSDAVVGSHYVAKATGGGSGNPVVFSRGANSGDGVCTVASDGTVQFTLPGTCVVAADQAGNASYQAAERQTQAIQISAPPADSDPPVLSCESPDHGWHAENISIRCTANDEKSGLADGADAAFFLATNVADGTSTDTTRTDEHKVCDTAGNCATAGPLGPYRIDRRAPTIACDSADDGWHANDVAIDCTARDEASGLADISDTNFSLRTSVPDGSEESNASTDSHKVCDAAGNCATAGPVSGNKIDRKSPTTACDPPDSGWHKDDSAISCTSSDSGSGLDSPASDAAFALKTSVPLGSEDSNASTDARQVCDAAGNCTTAGPIAGNKIDRKSATTTCDTPDSGWHKDNVAIRCTASDAGSGLADSSDSSFALHTGVAPGAEDPNAETDDRHVCDQAGNCVSVGPLSGNKVDRNAPTARCDPADSAWHKENVAIDCAAKDDGSGLADSGDGRFSLRTAVPAGAEDANAQTETLQVCDQVTNCVTAGPVTGNKVDRNAPAVSITAQPNGSNGWFKLPPATAHVRARDNHITTLDCKLDGKAIDDAPAVGANTLAIDVSASADGRHSVDCTAADLAGNATSQSGALRVDSTGPNAPTASTDRQADYGQNWFKDKVIVNFASNGDPDLADGSPGSGVDPASVPPAVTKTQSGTYAVGASVSDLAGNSSAQTATTIRVDSDAPNVKVTCPQSPVLLKSAASGTVTASDGESGLAQDPSGKVVLDTSGVGTRSINAIARDNVGHSSRDICSYDVIYDFVGFNSPLANPPSVVSDSANKKQRFEFSLRGNQGLGVIAAGYPTQRPIDCNSHAATVSSQPMDVSLSYEAKKDLYTFEWTPGKQLGGSCREVAVKLDDGTVHRTWFALK